ncbi:MAG: CoA-binding protein [Chloroflexota bacterium]
MDDVRNGRRTSTNRPPHAPEAAAPSADDLARVRAFLDLAEGRGPVPLLDSAGIAELLRSARRMAIVGASTHPGRPSEHVMATLLAAGYECVPVNPNATEILGRRAYPTLAAAAAAEGPIDIVDVFRRHAALVEHAREAVAIGARCLWLQYGLVDWEAARIAHEGGLAIVMDRCTAVEVRRLRS